jgi:hypothetical protein
MTRKNNRPKGAAAPGAGEAADWLWVLAAAITKNRDKLLILEDEAGDYLPVFRAKEEGAAFLGHLDPEGGLGYQVQAMHLLDMRALAAEMSYRVLTLDGQGQVLDRWSPG